MLHKIPFNNTLKLPYHTIWYCMKFHQAYTWVDTEALHIGTYKTYIFPLHGLLMIFD